VGAIGVMKEKIRKVLGFLNAYKEFIFAAIILISQIVIVSQQIAKVDDREVYEAVYRGTDIPFSYESEDAVKETEDGYRISVWEETGESVPWTISDLKLKKGSYLITVQYEAYATKYGSVKMQVRDTENVQYFNEKTIAMLNESTQEGTKIWLDEDTESLEITIRYGGYGRLLIKEISIEEDVSARYTDIVKQVWFFVLLDGILLLLFAKKLLPVSSKSACVVVMLAGISLFASLPLFYDKLYTGHDIFFHMGRIRGIAEGLSNGQFPVRIYAEANNGYGYASSIFYGEMFLYIPAWFVMLGFPLQKAYQIFAVVVTVATCVVTYLCFARMFRSKSAGVLAALLYTCAPYRLVNVYIRAAAGEYTAMIFLPLIVYAMWTMFSEAATKKQQKYGWVWLAIGVTGVIQSHILTTEMVAVFLVLACVLGIRRFMKLRNLWTVVKAVVATVLWNLWFIVPFFEYYAGDYNVNSEHVYDLTTSGLYLPQIFSLFIGNSGINVERGLEKEMPLMLGSALALGMFLYLGMTAYLRRRKKTKDGAECVDLETLRIWKGLAVSCVLGVLALWMTSVYFPWEVLTEANEDLKFYVSAIQFPWRYMGMATILFTAIAVGMVVIVRRMWKLAAGVGVAVALAVLTMIPGGMFLGRVTTENYATTDYYAIVKDTVLFDGLYLPEGTDMSMFQDPQIVRQSGIVMEQVERVDGRLQITCANKGSTDKWMELPLIYYPNYKALDVGSGAELPLQETEGHTIRITVPSHYAGTVEVGLNIPQKWHSAERVSFISMIAAAVIVILLHVFTHFEEDIRRVWKRQIEKIMSGKKCKAKSDAPEMVEETKE